MDCPSRWKHLASPSARQEDIKVKRNIESARAIAAGEPLQSGILAAFPSVQRSLRASNQSSSSAERAAEPANSRFMGSATNSAALAYRARQSNRPERPNLQSGEVDGRRRWHVSHQAASGTWAEERCAKRDPQRATKVRGRDRGRSTEVMVCVASVSLMH